MNVCTGERHCGGSSNGHHSVLQHYLGTCNLPRACRPPLKHLGPSTYHPSSCPQPLPPRQLLLLLQHGPQPQLCTCPQRPSSDEGHKAQRQQHGQSKRLDSDNQISLPRLIVSLAMEKAFQVPAQPPEKPMLAIRGVKRVRTSPHLEHVQAMQWTRHLRTATSHNKRGDASIVLLE